MHLLSIRKLMPPYNSLASPSNFVHSVDGCFARLMWVLSISLPHLSVHRCCEIPCSFAMYTSEVRSPASFTRFVLECLILTIWCSISKLLGRNLFEAPASLVQDQVYFPLGIPNFHSVRVQSFFLTTTKLLSPIPSLLSTIFLVPSVPY